MTGLSFVWVTHHVGSTRWLKAELAVRAPHLHFAFSRPGLTTFKVTGPPATAATPMPSSFARAWGVTLGKGGLLEIQQAVEALPPGPPLRLHVFERDIEVPVEEQHVAERGVRAEGVEQALRMNLPDAFEEDLKAKVGDRVLDIVVPHGSGPNEPWLIGLHTHAPTHGPWPGGVPFAPPPRNAPSRAWSKLEEALYWADLEPKAGEVVVELGAAPGGASLNMLDRGLEVHGIDPGPMAPAVLEFHGPHGNRFHHHRAPASEVDRRALPPTFQWLLLDVNLAPMVTLGYVERYVALAKGGLRAALLTLKLNDDGVFMALPRLLERVRKLNPSTMRVTQLPSHRQEIVAILTW
ncbi:MAG TPA: SAM-dependent methyltransferase [Kofleriaceae bacterium]|nr:SAM-dependent methyltransferase [Kofleriaceae bacterium]